MQAKPKSDGYIARVDRGRYQRRKDGSISNEVSWNLQLAVRSGQLEAARALMGAMVASTLEEPGAIGYEWFVSDDGSICHLDERYADSEAALHHAGNFGGKFAERFMACFEPTGFYVCGAPDPEARVALDTLGAQYLGPFRGFKR